MPTKNEIEFINSTIILIEGNTLIKNDRPFICMGMGNGLSLIEVGEDEGGIYGKFGTNSESYLKGDLLNSAIRVIADVKKYNE